MTTRLYDLLNELEDDWSTDPEDLVDGLKGIADEVGGYVEKIYEGAYAICWTDENGKDHEQAVEIRKVGKSTYVVRH